MVPMLLQPRNSNPHALLIAHWISGSHRSQVMVPTVVASSELQGSTLSNSVRSHIARYGPVGRSWMAPMPVSAFFSDFESAHAEL